MSGNHTFGYKVWQETIDQLSKVNQPNISLSVLLIIVLTSYNTVFHDMASPLPMYTAHITNAGFIT